MKDVQSAGGIVVSPNGKILVVTNEIGSVTLPKGSIKDGERPIDAAKREILEESGLRNIEIHKELGVIVRPGYTAQNAVTPSVIKHIHVFLVLTSETKLNPNIEDVIRADWIDPDEVSKTLSRVEEVSFFEEHRDELGL